MLLDGEGIEARDVDLSRVFGEYTTFRDGPGSIVAERKLRLVKSSITGNEEGDGRPDIVSGLRPQLVRTTCGRSGELGDLEADWGVRRND